MTAMFMALTAGVFFALLIWIQRRTRRTEAAVHQLQQDLADKGRELQKAEHRVQQVLGCLNALYERKTSWQQSADFIVQSLGPLLDMETVVLLRWNPKASEFKVSAARGLSPQHVSGLRVRFGEGILGRAAQEGVPRVVQDSGPPPAGNEAFLGQPYAVFPLSVRSQTLGLLVFCRPQLGFITWRLAGLVAKHVELMLENADLSESTQRIYAELVGALTHAAGSKDSGSRGHNDHCRELVREMSREMHLPELLAEQIEFGALLHDVGKLGISDALLSKESALTPEEYDVVKQHPSIGYQMLRGVDFLRAVAPMVLYHHEWVNGDGYPEGLAGEEIPLGARMVAIADAWDAMTTDQPYRKALARSNAIAELRQQAGAQFDPKLVDIFLHVVERKPAGSVPSAAAQTNA